MATTCTHFVYILYSGKLNKYYVGKTADVNKRLAFHNSAYNTIWTKRGQPWILKASIPFANSHEASKAELFIKRQKSKAFIQKIIAKGFDKSSI
jgi:putative endonuclease